MGELREVREKILVDILEVAVCNQEVIIDVYNKVMKLEFLARKEGLLALEYEAELLPRDIPLCNPLIEMIELIVDGTDPRVFEEIMTVKFFCVYKYSGIDALIYYLYASSMLMIQAGISPRHIEALFGAVIPENVLVFKQKCKEKEEAKVQRVAECLASMTESERERLNNISKKMEKLSDENWKILVSNKDFWDWDRILPYLNEKIKAQAKKYMNDYRYYVIMRNPRIITVDEIEALNLELEKVLTKICS